MVPMAGSSHRAPRGPAAWHVCFKRMNAADRAFDAKLKAGSEAAISRGREILARRYPWMISKTDGAITGKRADGARYPSWPSQVQPAGALHVSPAVREMPRCAESPSAGCRGRGDRPRDDG
jgi:hypothetical protein